MSSPSSATDVAISMLKSPSLNCKSISICCFCESPVPLFLACPTNTCGSAPWIFLSSSQSFTAVSLNCVNKMTLAYLSFSNCSLISSQSFGSFGCSAPDSFSFCVSMYALLKEIVVVKFLTALTFVVPACSNKSAMYLCAGVVPCDSKSSSAWCAFIISARMLSPRRMLMSLPSAIFACSSFWRNIRSFFETMLVLTPISRSCIVFSLMHSSSSFLTRKNSSGSCTFTQVISTSCMYGATSGSFSVLISTASIPKFLQVSSIFKRSLPGDALRASIRG